MCRVWGFEGLGVFFFFLGGGILGLRGLSGGPNQHQQKKMKPLNSHIPHIPEAPKPETSKPKLETESQKLPKVYNPAL